MGAKIAVMRRAPTIALGAAVVGALPLFAVGCSFLITFDDVPEADASVPADARPPTTRDAGNSAADGGGGDAGPLVPVTPACDTSFPLEQVKGCEGFIDGAQICADNAAFTGYPGDRSKDVVTCSKSGATCVRHCVACAHNPNGFPDQCDQCMGKSNGTYCGTDMGWESENFRLLVTCTSDRMSAVRPCTRACDSNGGMGAATCKP